MKSKTNFAMMKLQPKDTPQSCPSEPSGLYLEAGLTNVGHRNLKELELKDAILYLYPLGAALPRSLPSTISARPTRSSAPSRIYAKEGWSPFLTSCLQPQEIAHPESITFATIPFSSFPSAQLRKRRKGRLGRYLGFHRDMLQGREIGRTVGRTTANATEAQDLPVDGLGLLSFPPESYSCSCHPDGKTCVHAGLREPLRKYLWRHLRES
ncbi:uncharacterized protein LOC121091616 [Falco naumanni]|uniref:uncharacterized protein LOC121091616 n=1 Tax=Falco naumanni TaxID=148594 RepID=UPI001ADE0568|nr:uncharacterized protein LOC121091616 [Falco naumanni]